MGTKWFFALKGPSQHAPDTGSLLISLLCSPLYRHEFVSPFLGTLRSLLTMSN